MEETNTKYQIKITVSNKTAIADGTNYICGNSDFTVFFDFDAEWDAFAVKTARFKYKDTYQDVVFTGNTCAFPMIDDAEIIKVGVYAENLHTTTPAWVRAKKSILSGGEVHPLPPADVYSQLLQLVEEGAVKGEKGDKGDPGDKGNDGAPGEKGFSPLVSVTDISGGHRISITDAEGASTFDVKDGTVTVDSRLSDSSANPVENKVITSALSGFADVAKSGSYNDLSDKPSIPTVPGKISAFENDSGYITRHQSLEGYIKDTDLTAVAFSGDYNDLINIPASTNSANKLVANENLWDAAGKTIAQFKAKLLEKFKELNDNLSQANFVTSGKIMTLVEAWNEDNNNFVIESGEDCVTITIVNVTPLNARLYLTTHGDNTYSTYYSMGTWGPLTKMETVQESGKNGIWTYKKYADGTAECWGTETKSVEGKDCALAGFQVYIVNHYLPFYFTSSKYHADHTTSIGNGWNIRGYQLKSTNSISTVDYSSLSGAQECTTSMHIIGRWK